VKRPSARKSVMTRYGFLLVLVLLLLAACRGGPTSTTPTPTPARTPTPIRTATGTPTPGPTPAPLPLELLSPRDGLGTEIGAIRVLGKTRPDAVVAVDGVTVAVDADGRFYRDVLLRAGTNIVEVVATDLSGQTVHLSRVVFYVATTAGLNFTVFCPADGLQVGEGTVTVAGGTRPDAVVGVNGRPVDVNYVGIFSATVSLNRGANLIEVVAADIQGNARYQTLVVFYVP